MGACVCVRVREGESGVRLCLCAKLHCMQVESLKMIVLRHSLCPIHDVGGWRFGNVIMMMYNLFVCINVHCEKLERAPHCQSPLSYCT